MCFFYRYIFFFPGLECKHIVYENKYVFLFVCGGKNMFGFLRIIDIACVVLVCRYMIVFYNVFS
jgi:hypothetical protein